VGEWVSVAAWGLGGGEEIGWRGGSLKEKRERMETMLRACFIRGALAAEFLLTARRPFWEEGDEKSILMLMVTVDSVEDRLGMSEKRLVSKDKLDCSRITQKLVQIAAEVGPSNACTIWVVFRALKFEMLWRLHDHTMGLGSALRSCH